MDRTVGHTSYISTPKYLVDVYSGKAEILTNCNTRKRHQAERESQRMSLFSSCRAFLLA